MENKLKNLVWLAVIIAILISAFAFHSFVRSYDRANEPTSFRSFTVSGEGRALGIPDVAEFNFSVITEGGTDIAKLQTENTEKINSILDFIKDEGVEDKDIRTTNFNLTPRREIISRPFPGGGSVPPPEIVGFTINQSVTVKVRDFEKAGEILSGAVERGANNVSQLRFTIDDPSSVEQEARSEAIAAAREKAESIADSGDFRVGRLLTIDEDGIPGPFFFEQRQSLDVGFGGAAPSSLTAPSLEPGLSEINITVRLTFEIE